jgi:hypothetical protein
MNFANEYDASGSTTPTGAQDFASMYDEAQGGGDPKDAPKTLTPQQKEAWNKFIEYVEKQGPKDKSVLDRKDKTIGLDLLKKFNEKNPDEALPTDVVTQVQQEIQNHRQMVINAWKKDPSVLTSPVKSEDEIMPDVSKVDGWPGTKTLSHKFPVATLTKADGKKIEYGTDLAAYDRDVKGKR